MRRLDTDVTIVVPAWNEAVNLPTLLTRIDASLAGNGLSYQVVVVDDRSDDDTVPVLGELALRYPVRRQAKRGPQGKGYSLVEGFSAADGAAVCMIDADLQYPPEAIAPMAAEVLAGRADLVVARRTAHGIRPPRAVVSWIWKWLSRLLHGLDVDTQAGLKVIRREVLGQVSLRPSAWAVDLELLVRARRAGYRIASHDIDFVPRQAGASKLRVPGAAGQMLAGAARLMLAGLIRRPIPPDAIP